jgi:REP-associated tyrosine transposase
MPNYRRAFVPGGCFFFTVNLLERRRTLLVDYITGLREAVATTPHLVTAPPKNLLRCRARR